MSETAIISSTIESEDRELSVLNVAPGTSAADIVKALHLSALKSVVLFFGGAEGFDNGKSAALKTFFCDGLIPAVVEHSSVIIDGGTKVGTMELLGEAVADSGYPLPIVGIAPEPLVTYPGAERPGAVPLDLNHTSFILLRGAEEWGAETRLMFRVASALNCERRPVEHPAFNTVAFVAGGGPVTKNEVLKAVRSNIPVIILKGTGGISDQLASLLESSPPIPVDADLLEIVRDGNLFVHPLSCEPEVVGHILGRLFYTDQVLYRAWERYADFNLNAILQQKRYKNYQGMIILLGIAAAAGGITYQEYFKGTKDANLARIGPILYGLLILLPIILTVSIAAANKFKNGMKWIFLRAGAEAIKREIFNYRTRTAAYRKDAAKQLADRLSTIAQKAMKTDINHTALVPYDKEEGFPPEMQTPYGTDDGFSLLDPASYINFRLRDQLAFYQKKAKKMNDSLNFYNWLIYIVTGGSTLLAIASQQVWIALTTAVITAAGTWLGLQQWDITLSKYNQGIADLNDILDHWNALNPSDQLLQDNRDHLVSKTEQVLQNEYEGWTQQMQQTLAERDKQLAEEEQKKKRSPKPVFVSPYPD